MADLAEFSLPGVGIVIPLRASVDYIARSLPWQGIQMLVVLDDSSKIDARLQTHKSSDAFKVVGLKVAPDGLTCSQDGLLLLVVGREQF